MADLKKVAFFHGKAANIVAQIEAGNIKAGNFVVGSDDNTLYYKMRPILTKTPPIALALPLIRVRPNCILRLAPLLTVR